MEPSSRAAFADAGADADALREARGLLVGRLGMAPRDALAWADLAEVECRLGERETARLCAEAAACLAPRDTRIRRVRAMVLLRLPEWGERGRHELGELEGGPGLGRPGGAGGTCRAPSGAG